MPDKCKWREKPGSEENCGLFADEGSDMCPRHTYLTKVKADQKLEKERQALLKGKALKQVRPNTREDLLKQGYQVTGNGDCRSCGMPIQWFRTPSGKPAPYDPMPTLQSPARSHFATCTRALEHRRHA
jgi:uncharacterized Zn finger protein (UPF0148 family)